ncbi:unnamed protein product [Nezara viridula]|uniref:Leucine-rich repeat-containing protein 59 n=1 Tax=Nezara viridula TaxID=85310 RepID=A0A9P0E4J6_NEZVI|nr:unnamed protein product [Nezara viridula]
MARKLNLKDYISDDTLDLSVNDLQEVPVKEIAAFPKVTSLDLSNNKLTTLSKSFSISLTHLVKLDLARNELRELPKNFGCLVNLKHLDLYKNKIETLPLSFANLKNLRWLDMKDNPLEPHWHHFVGPCLNAQDCKAAAKNVVNIAGMMNEEISTEVLRTQAKQKQIEENEIKEQAKKKEKQKEKKKRKNAAKLAEVSPKDVIENGSISEVETYIPESAEHNELHVKNNIQSTIGGKLRKVISGLVWSVIYCLVVFTLALLLLKLVNEPTHNRIMLRLNKYAQSAVAHLPGSFRLSWHKFSTRLLNNIKYASQYTVTVWQILYKSFLNGYAFLISDPSVDVWLNMIIDSFLTLYIRICELFNMFFSTIKLIPVS